jgi:N-acylglucosamine 2-epimerase
VNRSGGELSDGALLEFYRDHLDRVLLPFWMRRALDRRNGGVYTCFSNDGTHLVSRDKYTWSQGRLVWVLSRLASLRYRGVLNGDSEEPLEHARKTVGFLRENAFLENGNCTFLLSETGEKKESAPGGLDTSIYADCFVALGFAEYGRVSRDHEILEAALKLYDSIEDRIRSGRFRSEPYPVPEGYAAHSISMILLNVVWEIFAALRSSGHPRAGELEVRAVRFAQEILDDFRDESGMISEMLPEDGSEADTLLARHLNPGHALESAWFVMTTVAGMGREELVRDAVRVVERAFEVGWDAEHGGLLRFVDRDGGEPHGQRIGHPYEDLILDTWSTKLWWPHAEALYATLLAAELAREEVRGLYELAHEYTFRTFPNPDPEVGEWVQIRDREGRPVEKLVALPVKDPYHAPRAVLLIVELLYHKGKPHGSKHRAC